MIHEAGAGEERFDRESGQRRGPVPGRFGGGADSDGGRAPGPASPLAIALFGAFDVRLHGLPLPLPRSQKSRSSAGSEESGHGRAR